MALDIYFRDDVEADLIASVMNFVVGQLSSEQPNMAAISVIISFATAHSLQYKIDPFAIRNEVACQLEQIGQSKLAKQIERMRLLTV